MTIQECYQKLGGDYTQAEKRIPSEALIKRFVTKFLNDDSYEKLYDAMQSRDWEEAFGAAHTLKGVSGNLSFDKLCKSASQLTELLRAEKNTIPAEADELMQRVTQDYQLTVSIIREYLGTEE